jgi:hypothetical protein
MEIYNIHSWDIFLQGFFLLICFALGLYIVFNNNLETFRDVDKISKFSKKLSTVFFNLINFRTIDVNQQAKGNYNYLIFVPMIIILSFIIGIVGKGIANDWIDSNNKNHLYLKSLWSGDILKFENKTLTTKKSNKIVYSYSDDSNNFDKLDSLNFTNEIRKNSFYTVFGKSDSIKEHITNRYIEQIYYNAKHKIIKDENYYNYVRKSQIMSEYSRVFSLGFFFLTTCGLLNLIIMTFRILFDDFKEEISSNDNKEEIDTNKKERKAFAQFKYSLKNYLNETFNIPTSVIILMLLFSLLFINFFVNPFFDYYSLEHLTSNYLRLISVFLFTYYGIAVFTLQLFSKNFKRMKFSFFIYAILFVLSYSGYFVSSRSWLISEQKVSRKTYGLYKSMHLSDSIEEIKFAQDYLHLNILTKKNESINPKN